MVRLREELVKSSSEPSKITRLKVWVKSRTRKDGTPVNITAAEKIVSIDFTYQYDFRNWISCLVHLMICNCVCSKRQKR